MPSFYKIVLRISTFMCRVVEEPLPTTADNGHQPLSKLDMGHADIETTMRIYTHLSDERDKASRESLLKYFNRTKNEDENEEP